LNIEDILSATKIIINQNIKPGKYNVINNKQTNVFKLIESVNKLSNKKILIRWGKQKVRKEKIYNYNKLPGWKATNSNFNNLIEFLIEKP
jgi:hypothetical protein